MARETGSESPGDPLAAEFRRWYLNARRRGTVTKVHAEGFALGDGFLVLRGSQAFVQEASGFSRPQDKLYRDLRARLVEAGCLRARRRGLPLRARLRVRLPVRRRDGDPRPRRERPRGMARPARREDGRFAGSPPSCNHAFSMRHSAMR